MKGGAYLKGKKVFALIFLFFCLMFFDMPRMELEKLYIDYLPYLTVQAKGEKFLQQAVKDIFTKEEREKAREEEIVVVATAYYGPLPNQSSYITGSYRGDIRLNGNGITKTEKPAKVGYIAADWNVLPKGTRVYVPGYGDAIVEDIGPAIKGHKIDIFTGYGDSGLQKAIEWGVRKGVKIQIK